MATESKIVIVTRGVFVGQVMQYVSTDNVLPANALICEGQRVAVVDYVELFIAIGLTYTPKMIKVPKACKWWHKVLGIKPGYLIVRNPELDAYHFNLPDFRSESMRGVK
jgi:hypothetical protein